MSTFSLRRTLIGHPLATAQQAQERLNKIRALAVFSSDNLSSTAYATEEIKLVLILAGTAALGLSWPIALTIVALVLIVAFSYYQTVHAYPSGGGAYIVAHDNLGEAPGLVAGAALLIDYVLTVAVSMSAAAAAITSAFPALGDYRVLLGVTLIALVTLMNLRGVRESGTIFAIPTYMFIATFYLMLAVGFYQWFAAGRPVAAPVEQATEAVQVLSLLLVLRAFASGCTALTGIEAISNGVTAFKPPESDNAGKTLIIMVLLLSSLFLGITFLSQQFGIQPDVVTHETLVSQLARHSFGDTPLYFLTQLATMLILSLAANTAFNGFPRLASIIARDRYLPRQLANLGDRLVFSNGILLLGALSAGLLAAFGGIVTRLIPLYMVGVFISFTLSQAGMVRRWRRVQGPHWRLKATINGFGAMVTGIVMVVVGVSKFSHGAWAVMICIPLLFIFFKKVHTHYLNVGRQLRLAAALPTPRVRRHRVIVPIAGVHRGVLQALEYARSLSPDVTAVYVEVDPQETKEIKAKWARWGEGVRLVVLPSPYRSLIGPLIDYVNKIDDIRKHDEVVTIVLPQFLPARWWHNLLHNQSAWLIRLAFLFRSNTVVTDVPYHLER